ncbi:hypothetical protein JCM8097_006865 [Rhodosporidiobolus ruineniae]
MSARISSPTPSLSGVPPPRGDPLFSRRPRLSDLSSPAFWIGDYNYKALFSFRSRTLPFFGTDERLPVVLAFVLGLQHALAMVGGLVVPPLLLAGSSGANLSTNEQTYTIAAALIWCGLGTLLQCSRIPLGKGFYLGSGVLNVIGTSFVFVTTGLSFINTQYSREDGMCSYAEDGVTKLPCREAFGAMLGSASTVAVIGVFLSFTPPRYLRKIFTPLVTGAVLLTIGLALMSSGITNWAGGSGCQTAGSLCLAGTPHAAPWGSPRLIGLGFSVWVSIVLFDVLGPPFFKNISSALGLIVGIIIAAACGYFQKDKIDAAPAATFLWTTTFPLSVRGELVLPFLASYLVVISEAIGNITATCAASRLPIDTPEFGQRLQGGILSDLLWACLAGLATVPPSTTFSQNVSVISLSNNASRVAGYVCAFILLIMGIFAKFGAIFVAMPTSLIGGLTVYLFSAVCIAGLQILSTVSWTRRSRFIATVSLSLGFASVVKPTWFGSFFTYEGSNHALRGFLDALTLLVEEPYMITLLLAVPLQFLTPLGDDDLALQAGVVEASELGTGTSASKTRGGRMEDDLEAARGVEEVPLEEVDVK